MRRSPGILLATLAAAVLPIVGSGCSGSSEPARVATTIAIAPSSATLVSVGATQQFTAVVKDQNGDTLIGASVAWSPGNAAAVTVSMTGLVTAVANGTVQVTASSGSASQSVTVTVAQAAAQLVLVSGDAQAGTVGQALALPLVVQVNDATAHPIQGVTVTFAAAGTVGSPSAPTGANGQAQTSWTLGTVVGAQSATANVAALSGTTITFGATAGPGAAASITKQAGDNQTALAGAAVATHPAVVVKDAYNNVKPGVSVTFAVFSGGGSATGTTINTNAGGAAQVGGWTLGAAGSNTLTATVSGSGIAGNPATFTATATPVTGPASVTIFTGNAQMGLVGHALNVRPAVRVTDAGNAPVAGASVAFAVASGGGSITGATATTNAGGVAQVGNWVIGASDGTNTLTATVPGAGITGNPVTFTATGATGTFDITIQNVGPELSPAAQSAFDAAVAKWQRIIYQDIPNMANLSADSGDCGSWSPAVGPVDVDDVLILVRLDSIDGPGKVLGSAGPCYVRSTSRLTVMGSMRFDTADVATLVAAGQLQQVITHEMGHVLGFGTLWTQTVFNCLQSPSAEGAPVDTYYSCAKGLAMFDSIGGTSYTGGQKVPVENCGPASPAGCGAGTINGHWREPVLVDELMTGYVTIGVANPLSRLSAAAMEDLGYVVNYAGADAYVQTFTLRAFGAAAPLLYLGDDIHRGPLHVVDRSGRVVRVIQPGARR
jgi:hypothetical protein